MMTEEQLLAWQIPRLCTATADWLACILCLLPMRHRFSGFRLGLVCAAGLGVYALLFGLVWWMESRSHRGALQPGAHVSLGTAAMAFVIYVFSSISYAPFETPFGGSNTMDVYNFRTLIYLAGGALLYGYHLQLHDLQDKREMDAMQNLLHLQYETYKRSQESIDLVNRKYHDLKHQIALLRSQGNEERDGVLDQMESEIRSYEALNVTGNKVLDTVLTAKSLHCQAQGIQMTCVADGQALGFMSVMDISSLFGNALDNAIESTGKIADPEKRLIHLAVSRQKGFLCIRIENCYEGDLQFADGKLQTTKQDTRYHGFGLKSIQATAEKYGGTAQIKAADGWFELQVLIPIPPAGRPVPPLNQDVARSFGCAFFCGRLCGLHKKKRSCAGILHKAFCKICVNPDRF